jgi:hypothetical protein
MPNKYSESNLVDLYLRAGLEGRPLPEIKIRGKQLEDLVDSFVEEMGEISTKLTEAPKAPDTQRGYYIELLNSLIDVLPFMSGNFDTALGPGQLLEDLRNLELGKQSKRLKAVGTGRSLDVATSNFRGEVMAAVSFLSKQFKNETKACKWMAYNLEPHVNDRLVHVIPSNGHNAVKTLKPETIRRWYQTFKKSTKDSTKSRNPAIIDSYQRATRIWRSYMAGQDFEEIKPRLGEEAATFILNHIILTTRDIRDPEETYEGD